MTECRYKTDYNNLNMLTLTENCDAIIDLIGRC